MAAIFPPKANVIGRAVLLAVAVLFAAGIGWWWLSPRTDWARRVGFAIDQPVPFSHEHHVAGLGIDCRFCHVSVEVSANAGLPPTWTCMTCHSQIWTNAALLAPVRESLAEGKPLAWDRINNLPDYVYFNHSIHVAKGVGCASCHGQVNRMPLSYKAASLTQFGLDAHGRHAVAASAAGALRHSQPHADGLLDMPSVNAPVRQWPTAVTQVRNDFSSVQTYDSVSPG